MKNLLVLLAIIGIFSPKTAVAQWHHATPQWSCVAASGQRVIVAGSHGSMLISPDAGINFSHVSIPQADSIIDVALLNPAIGFAITSRNQLLQSEDSGKTWRAVPLTLNNPVRFSVVGDLLFLIEKSGRCFRRSSGGEWGVQGTASVRRVTSLSFANQQIGVLTDSDSLLFRTSDAGATWEKIDVGNNSLVQAVSLYQEVGVMFCKNDQILTSSDQGITWDSVAAKEFSTVRVNDVLAMDEEHYLVFGGFGASKPIGFSSNAGRTWRYSIPFLSNDQMEFLDAAVASNGAVLLVGNFSTILRSEDGGKNWQVRSNSVLTTNNGQFPYLAGISFATDSIAIAVVAGATDNFSWLKTSDAGTTWQYQRQTLGSVSSIAFLYDL